MQEERERGESPVSFDLRVRRLFGVGLDEMPDGDNFARSDDACLVIISPHGEVWVEDLERGEEGAYYFTTAYVVSRGGEVPEGDRMTCGLPVSVRCRYTPWYDERFHCMRTVVAAR